MVGGPQLDTGSGGGTVADDDDNDDRQRSRSRSSSQSSSSSSGTTSSEPEQSAGQDDRLDAPGGADTSGSDNSTPTSEQDTSSGGDDSAPVPDGQSKEVETPDGEHVMTSGQGKGPDIGSDEFEEGFVEARYERQTGQDVAVQKREDGTFAVEKEGRYGRNTTRNKVRAVELDQSSQPRRKTPYGSTGILTEILLEKQIERENPGIDADMGRTKDGGIYVADTERKEQLGDVDWSFGLGGEEDEVEEGLRNASDSWSKTVGGTAETIARKNPFTKEATATAYDLATGGGGPNLIRMIDDETIDDVAADSVKNAAEITNLPGYGVTALEAGEYSYFAATEDDVTEKTAAVAAARGQQSVEFYQRNPTKAVGTAIGVAASLPASTGAFSAIGKVSPRAAKGLDIATDPWKAGKYGYRAVKDSNAGEVARRFAADESGQAQLQLERRRKDVESESDADEVTESVEDDAREAYKDEFDEGEAQEVHGMSNAELNDELDSLRRDAQLRDLRESDADIHPDTTSGIGGLKQDTKTQSETEVDLSERFQTDIARSQYEATTGRSVEAETEAESESVVGERAAQLAGVSQALSTAAEVQTEQSTQASVELEAQTTQEMTMAEAQLQGQQQEVSLESTIEDQIEQTREISAENTIESRFEHNVEAGAEASVEANFEGRVEAAIEANTEARIEAVTRAPQGNSIEGRPSEDSNGGLLGKSFTVDVATPDDIISGDALDLDDVDFEG